MPVRTGAPAPWNDPDVVAEHLDVQRFRFDLGADGVRIDSATMPAKNPRLADFDPSSPPVPHPYIDRDAVHDIYRAWRAMADSYDPPRALIGEIWLDEPDRLGLYLRPDEMHTAFNFDYLNCAWDPEALRHVIDAHAPVDAPATWVLSNHDVTRHVTRYGRAGSSYGHALRQHGTTVDLTLGTRRARAALLFNLALPGPVYLYQGEELGTRRGRGHPGLAPPGPDLPPYGRSRHRPRRLPRPVAVVRRRAPVRLQPLPRFAFTVAAAARLLGRSHRRRPGS